MSALPPLPSDAEIDAIDDRHLLRWLAPRGRESVREFARELLREYGERCRAQTSIDAIRRLKAVFPAVLFSGVNVDDQLDVLLLCVEAYFENRAAAPQPDGAPKGGEHDRG